MTDLPQDKIEILLNISDEEINSEIEYNASHKYSLCQRQMYFPWDSLLRVQVWPWAVDFYGW